MVGETEDDEDDSEDYEADYLDGFTAYRVDCCDGEPVSGDGASAGDDEVADGLVVEELVDGVAVGVADLGEDDGVVETETWTS